MKKILLRSLWEAFLVISTLLLLAMIGSPTSDVQAKESAYSAFMFYGIVSYLIKRGRWLLGKLRNKASIKS